MTEFLTLGVILGLSAGLAPGPLLALVIAETVRHDVKAGLKVALSPLVTDLPIILLAIVVLSQLSDYHRVLGVISLVGGGVVAFMGLKCVRPNILETGDPEDVPKSLRKGILVNALSPHPYLFWLSVGGPIMDRAMSVSLAALVGFLAGFYALLIGSKMLLAIVVARSKTVLSGTAYLTTMRVLGIALWVLAALLVRDGLGLLGLW